MMTTWRYVLLAAAFGWLVGGFVGLAVGDLAGGAIWTSALFALFAGALTAPPDPQEDA